MNAELILWLIPGVLLIQSVFGFNIRKILNKLDDLHDWHSKEDSDGVKIWYVRKSLEDAMIKIGDSISAQTESLRSFESMIASQNSLLTQQHKILEKTLRTLEKDRKE